MNLRKTSPPSKQYNAYNKAVLFFKILLFAFIGLNILAPIVIYAWPNLMAHMIFQTFSN